MDSQSLFDNLEQLPSIPSVLQGLIKAFEHNEVDMMAVAKMISLDQIFSAKVLNMANSAYFGRGRAVASTEDAVIRLGANTIRNLVMASGVSQAFSQYKQVEQQTFWFHTLYVATIAKALAKQAKSSPSTAFSCAMLHNLGDLLIRVAMPEQSQQMAAKISNESDRAYQQQQILGFSYVDVGAELAKRWNFSKLFQTAIHRQLDPISSRPFNHQAGYIHLAVLLASGWQNNLSNEAINAELDEVLLQWLKLNPVEILTVQAQSKEEADSLMQILQ
ncbi:HDOD domain-containing protein [Motilimonas pumila]|uniref:HDOD domain-containing protein n=1 Tax=Motilimonas pumila TaxID=2303987 RepID=A0A418YH65_9GAMM|nr:HDOD domain-containing protein [Motilimonas pumila]RJG49435.1 HDOD domain-containing protein [Motilimonas pumila]